ncbi:TrpB-like pyridoxal phosphate-dependent enzyme [Mesotoga sp. BH458_6_3_2_1]|uniref:TrpB-like pyridoxal phosphate-dependent enzyme n=1 Tax=Mesotoga sp. BH458_6_3_2_1 TaxID=1437446 RepID=UPI000EF1F7FF|nr:TrpB-like pyridoxal phosphate-dependent enzyme [Mesotoga sp. BH458_6_3_2_1]RLL81750.1 tryptophan synthase subunit beta [Mesotoga sp. BH458_6_3_2_1]
MKKRIVVNLKSEELPRSWYNIKADLPFKMDPPLNPATNKVIDPKDMMAIFPKSIVEQEMSEERFIPIPEPILDEYVVFRPSPLIRATFLEEYLNTPARIYYKYEGNSPTGSHKTNTAIAQAYYNKLDGVTELTTETGAGQWGSALSYAGRKFGLTVRVFMVRNSYQSKPMRQHMMKMFNGAVEPSPGENTVSGRKFLEDRKNFSGSLGMAISEAIEIVLNSTTKKYSLGSVLDHVLLHQTIIGLEVEKQLEILGEKPSSIIGCHGGGSNFGGTILPFVKRRLNGENIEFVACEPESCPTLSKGEYRYDSGDTAGFTPLLKMYTLGRDFVPPAIHAGGLRYHGAAPLVSRLVKEGIVTPEALPQGETFKAGLLFATTEGIVPAPESTHAIAGAVRRAIEARENREEKVIVFTLSGNGSLDLSSYTSTIEAHKDVLNFDDLRESSVAER